MKDWDFDVADINDKEIIDFVYDSAIKYSEATLKSRELARQRLFILLIYLLVIVGFSCKEILQAHNIIFWLIFALFYGITSVVTLYHINPKYFFCGYKPPVELLKKDYMIESVRGIKFIRIMQLQEEIESNKIATDKLLGYYKYILLSSLAFPCIIGLFVLIIIAI